MKLIKYIIERAIKKNDNLYKLNKIKKLKKKNVHTLYCCCCKTDFYTVISLYRS